MKRVKSSCAGPVWQTWQHFVNLGERGHVLHDQSWANFAGRWGRVDAFGRGTVSVDVDRKTVVDLLLNGFFPTCGLGERPAARQASGFRELGLPFEADTGITRHLAAFLAGHGDLPDKYRDALQRIR